MKVSKSVSPKGEIKVEVEGLPDLPEGLKVNVGGSLCDESFLNFSWGDLYVNVPQWDNPPKYTKEDSVEFIFSVLEKRIELILNSIENFKKAHTQTYVRFLVSSHTLKICPAIRIKT